MKENRREISHIYLLNPFSFLKDSDEEHSRKLKDFVDMAGALRPFGCDLVFTLEDTCLGGWQVTAEFHKKLVSTMEEVGESGITGVCVSDPYLTEVFRSSFKPYDRLSRFGLYWGLGGKLTHEIKLRYLTNLDMSLVTVHPSLNRNPAELTPLLGRMLGRAEVVVNYGCPPHCGMEFPCRALRFHIREDEYSPEEREKIITAYMEECRAAAPHEPTDLLTLPVILPEHLDYYFVNFGADLFQVLTPHDDEEAACRILEYYFKRESPDNLADLLYRPLCKDWGEGLPVSLIKQHHEKLYNYGDSCKDLIEKEILHG
ncbi:MAG: hypothetical protein M1269_00685 [Chloroflexi bacterium]|nr:hypothetical protein [Chloroflexota bacterium]